MAGSRTYRTKVLVLDKTKLKETDLILTMLDERGRQLRAVAKGARKPGGRLAARCELFCTVDMLLAHGRSLDVVSQAELMEAPLGAAPDYETTCAASAIAEVARVCSFEDAEDPFTFAITQRALALVGGDAHRSTSPCDGIHVGSVMMRRRGLLVVTYRPVGTSTLDARSTGGFPVRGE